MTGTKRAKDDERTMSAQAVSRDETEAVKNRLAAVPRISPEIKRFIEQHSDLEDRPERVREEIEARFPQPWPSVASIRTWQGDIRRARTKHAQEYYQQAWAEAADSLIPAAIVSLEASRRAVMGNLTRWARQADDKPECHKTARLLNDTAGQLAGIAGQILTFCGAIQHTPEHDPAAIREAFIQGELAKGQTREQAEALFDGLAQAAGAPALGAGE